MQGGQSLGKPASPEKACQRSQLSGCHRPARSSASEEYAPSDGEPEQF